MLLLLGNAHVRILLTVSTSSSFLFICKGSLHILHMSGQLFIKQVSSTESHPRQCETSLFAPFMVYFDK